MTIKGTGFNLAALEWVAFGDPTHADSQAFNLVTVTGTEIQVVAPPLPEYDERPHDAAGHGSDDRRQSRAP